LLQVIKDHVSSLYHHGFKRFLLVNAHGDNRGIIQAALSELGHECTNLRYNFQDFWDFPSFRTVMRRAFGDDTGGHADATDASILLAIAPQFVKPDRLTAEFIRAKYWVSRDLVPSLYSTSGVMNADQRLATKEIGHELLQAAIDGYRTLLNELRAH
jgi:creatinine amidohydrolase